MRRRAKAGGGGGSRTRVRRAFAAGIYMRVLFWCFAAGLGKRLKPPAARSDNDLVASAPDRASATSLRRMTSSPDVQARSGWTSLH